MPTSIWTFDSLIDNIFLSSSVARLSGNRDFFIVASDRTIDEYVKRVPDHRPIVMRVSLTDTPAMPERDLNSIYEDLVRRACDGKLQPALRERRRPPSIAPVRPQANAAGAYEWRGLDKEAFLTHNRERIADEIAAVNGKLEAAYGARYTRLTEADAWVLTYIEAGLRGGHVDPDHRHLEGERGLLPLPSNVRYCNGDEAPAWNSQNYSDRKVPYDHILDGFASGQSPDVIMRSTKYVYAGKQLMRNRARNIEVALALLRST